MIHLITAAIEYTDKHGPSRASYSSYTPREGIDDEDRRNADPAISTIRGRLCHQIRITQWQCKSLCFIGFECCGINDCLHAAKHECLLEVASDVSGENAVRIRTSRGNIEISKNEKDDMILPLEEILLTLCNHIKMLHDRSS